MIYLQMCGGQLSLSKYQFVSCFGHAERHLLLITLICFRPSMNAHVSGILVEIADRVHLEREEPYLSILVDNCTTSTTSVIGATSWLIRTVKDIKSRPQMHKVTVGTVSRPRTPFVSVVLTQHRHIPLLLITTSFLVYHIDTHLVLDGELI